VQRGKITSLARMDPRGTGRKAKKMLEKADFAERCAAQWMRWGWTRSDAGRWSAKANPVSGRRISSIIDMKKKKIRRGQERFGGWLPGRLCWLGDWQGVYQEGAGMHSVCIPLEIFLKSGREGLETVSR